MSALGTTTKSASTACGTDDVAARVARRSDRALLEAAVELLLPGERVCMCGKRTVPGKQVALKLDPSGRAFYGNVRACGSVWLCPYCASKVGRARAEELRRAVDAARARGLVVTLVTFTVGHKSGDDLRELVDGLAVAMRKWRGGRTWQRFAAGVGYVGSVRNLEVTWGERTGWHPHSHALLFTARALTEEERGWLRDRWASCAVSAGGYASVAVGLHLTDADADVSGYLSKQDQDVWQEIPATDARRGWGAAEELTYWHTKRGRGERFTPWGLLRALVATGWAEYADRFVEYASAFHGRRQLYWSRGLRDELGLGGEATDAELADAEGTAEVVYVLEDVEWAALLRHDARWAALALYEAEGLGAFRAYLDELVSGPTVHWQPWEWWGERCEATSP